MSVLRSSSEQLLQQLTWPQTVEDVPQLRESSEAGVQRSQHNPKQPVKPCCGKQTQLIRSRVTREAVLAMRDITAPQLAERFKRATMRIVLLRQCQNNGLTSVTETVADAVLAYGVIVLLAMIAADKVLLEANAYNLDRMAPQAQRVDVEYVRSCLQLSHEQRQQIALAYECVRDQCAALLQQQQQIVAQLQALLTTGTNQPFSAHAAVPTAATACALPTATAAQQGADGPSNSRNHAAGCHQVLPLASSSSSSNSTEGGSSDSTFSSAYSRLHRGLLDLEGAEQADDLLQQLQRVVRLDREAARNLIHVCQRIAQEVAQERDDGSGRRRGAAGRQRVTLIGQP